MTVPPVVLLLTAAPLRGGQAQVGGRSQLLGATVHLIHMTKTSHDLLLTVLNASVCLTDRHYYKMTLCTFSFHLAEAMRAGRELDLLIRFIIVGLIVLLRVLVTVRTCWAADEQKVQLHLHYI